MGEKFEAVISGVSGRFPDCESVPEFRDKLYAGESFMSVDSSKWPVNFQHKYTDTVIPSATGKLKHIKKFDPVVFRVNYAVATCTDALNRKVLEPSFEAVMDAGLNPYDLFDRHIGVYMAYSHSDCDINSTNIGKENRPWVVGSSKTMIPNRISFALGLTGPSVTYCSDLFGNLNALHEAYKNVSEGYIEAAIVGVAATVQNPLISVLLSKMNILTMDAVTRVFDKNANGYGRSESVVILFIQRAIDAKRNYATIDFTGYTYFGSNPKSLLDFNEDLLKNSTAHLYRDENDYKRVADVSFVEMSACGLKKFDATESNFIADVFCKERKAPLLVGSVKSNMGNSEAAAPYIGVMKALFALESGIIVQNQNLNEINDEIEAFKDNKLKVLTIPTTLPSDKILVNSVALTGALSQVVLRRNSKEKKSPPFSSGDLPRLIVTCARTEEGIQENLKKLETMPFNADFISLTNDVFGGEMPFHIFRGYAVVSPDPNFEKKLVADTRGNKHRPIWFLFSGMGSQWNKMGEGLLGIPIIAETVKKCDEVLRKVGVDIYRILTSDNPAIFDNIMHSFVGIITIQIALVEVLKALGIKPDGIIGHSVGENACAYVDGCITLEQAVLSSHARGMASIEAKTIKGMMAAVGKGYQEIKDVLPESIEVACHNSATSCTLSGPTEDVENYVKQLQEEKVFAKAVNVANIAYHTKYIAPVGPNILARLQQIIPESKKRSSKWISTSVPESDWDKQSAQYCSAEYFTNNLLKSVLFEEGCKHIPLDALVIEISPHGLLQAIVTRSLPETCTNVSLTRRNTEGKNMENLLNAVGRLYIAGCVVKVNALFAPIEYPVPRETPSVAPLATWDDFSRDTGMFIFDPVGSHSCDPIVIRANEDSPYYYLKDHQIDDHIVLPTSFYLYLTWWVYCVNQNITLGSQPIVFEDVELCRNTTTSLSRPRKVTIFIQKGSGTFEILKYNKSNPDKTTRIMSGILYKPDDNLKHAVNEKELGNVSHTISEEQFYRVFKDVGYQLENSFHNLTEMKYNEIDCYAKIKWPKNWVLFLDSLMKFSMFTEMKNETDLLYTHKIRKLEIAAEEFSSLEEGTTLLCHKHSHTNILTCNGLAMYSIENKRFVLKNQTSNISLQGLSFVSYQNPRCQNVDEFYKLCLYIAIDNVGIMCKKNNSKLNVIAEDDERHSDLLKNVVKNSDTLKTNVLLYGTKEALINKFSLMNECCMMLVTDNFRNIEKYAIDCSFLLVAILDDYCVPAKIHDGLVQVTKQRFADIEFHLFKKKTASFEKSIQIIENEKSSADHTSKSKKSQLTCVVKQSTEWEDVCLMFNDYKKPSDPRYMFVMDNKMPSSNSLESQQLLDLPISVLQNGEWGSYQNILENSSKLDENTGANKNLPGDIQLESINLQYLSCDQKIELNDNNQIYGIEYSGVEKTGERVMGLALVDCNNPTSIADPILRWKVPTKWSLEDAATIPFIYSQAYSILDSPVIRGKQYLDSVLINIGDEGVFCEACISILFSRKCTVYVTVSSHEEAVLLKNKFPQLDDEHIFNSQECSFQNEILKITNGFGVSLVVNCLPAIQNVTESLNSIAVFGYFIHIGGTSHWQDEKLGLYPFLKSISFTPVQNEISSLLKLPADEKQALKALVEEGIETGIVVPVDKKLQIQGMPESIVDVECCENSYTKNIYRWFPKMEMCHNANQKIRYDNNLSYVIVEGEKKKTRWFELVEWLVSKGARKFIACVDDLLVEQRMSHRMKRFLAQKKSTITYHASQNADTVQGAESLLFDANKIGPLEAIFFVSVASAGRKIDNMNLAARKYNPNIHFVSIFSGGLKECESRRFAGSPAVVIHDNKIPHKLADVLPQIDGILSQFDNSNSPTLYRFTNTKNKTADSPLRGYLPHDIDILENIADDLSDKLEFVEVTTKAPRYSTLKNCSPIFIISTLGPRPLQNLLSNLMSPAFCTSISSCSDSVIDMASMLYESLNNIQSKGKITLMSETWCSPIAFEMMKLLERDNKKFKLLTLDGNPLIWKRRVASLGPVRTSQFENNLIVQLLNLNDEKELETLVDTNKPLVEKLSDYLNTYNGNYLPVDVSNIIKVIQSIRAGLEMVFKYEYNGQLLKNMVSIVRNHNGNESLNLSMTSKSFVHEEDDYFRFLSSPEVSNKINGYVSYTLGYD